MTEEQIVLNLEEMAGFKSLNLGCKNVLHNAIALINRRKATINELAKTYKTLKSEKEAELEQKTMDVESLTTERDALYETIAEQKAEIEKVLATIVGFVNEQETMQKYIAEKDAEIERLKAENERILSNCRWCEENYVETAKKAIKFEAIKEFAKRLKNNDVYIQIAFLNTELGYGIFLALSDEIDNLVKEMAGDGDA